MKTQLRGSLSPTALKCLERILVVAMVLLVTLGSVAVANVNPAEDPLGWPKITKEMKPGTRWWWMGNALSKEDIGYQLEEFAEAGLGYVEITPIYGVRGYEDQTLEYLSPEWLEMLDYTTAKAARLDMGVDMLLGAGWNFGGPNVTLEDAAHRVLYRRYTLGAGQRLTEPIGYFQTVALNPDIPGRPVPRVVREAPLQAVVAYSDNGQVLDLISRVQENGRLDWEAPSGNWTLYAVFIGWSGKQMERAAPGESGDMIDYFDKDAMKRYLSRFDAAMELYQAGSVRAYFNDSYEVDGADWTPNLFTEFQNRRGYDLRRCLPALFDEGSEEEIARVKSDFRETMSELLFEGLTVWTDWAHGHQTITRNQAHGGPGNLVDLYAASDIPETESENPLEMKFATSAAHLTGKKLVSSESCTGMSEHFLSNLADIKSDLDRYLIGGVNHNFYHGSTYTPKDVPFPGWKFYASVNLIPQVPIWRHFAALNNYIARVQSFLQTTEPDSDILLYLPIHDVLYHDPTGGPLYRNGIVGTRTLLRGSFAEVSQELWDQGYTFDYVSDMLLQGVEYRDGVLRSSGGAQYDVVVVPSVRLMPLDTLEKLIDLAKAGAAVIFRGGLPTDVPGYNNLLERRVALEELLASIGPLTETTLPGMRKASIGNGYFLVGDDIGSALESVGVTRESMVDLGLWFNRQSFDHGYSYFIKNMNEEELCAWVPLGVKSKSVVMFDPMHSTRGVAAVRDVAGVTQVYVQLQPGETCLLRAFSDLEVSGEQWRYLEAGGDAYEISGPWSVTFIDGGPTLPKGFRTAALASWTQLGGAEAEAFSGTAKYTIAFRKPSVDADDWVLDLGTVCVSARVTVNGQHVGTLIGAPFRVRVGDALCDGVNILEVEVTNLGANRIRYMDRNSIPWRDQFYNRGIGSYGTRIGGSPWSAADWPVFDSGLLGPVNLIPMQSQETF